LGWTVGVDRIGADRFSARAALPRGGGRPPTSNRNPEGVRVPGRDKTGGSDMALSAAATEFRALNITQHRLAQLFAVNPRTVRHWRYGDRRLPRGVAIVLRLLAAGVITISQVEQAAAVPAPAQTNGSAKPKPPTPRLVTPAPEQSALAPTFTDPSLTTAEKICALTPGVCRWPCGDPKHPDFHFCGGPAAKGPYCEEHRIAAHMTPPVSGQKPSSLAAWPPRIGSRNGTRRPSHDVGGTVALSV